MTDRDAITPEEAAELLGISKSASAPKVERAYTEKLEALEKKIAQAPTAALKNKYRLSADRLKQARECLDGQDDGSDLPALELVHHPEPSSVSAPAKPEPTPAPTRAPTPDPSPVQSDTNAASAPEPAPIQTSESKAASAPSARKLPMGKILGIAAAAAVVIGGLFVALTPSPTATYAGTYRDRIEYRDIIMDYTLVVAKNGTITGTNVSADGQSQPIAVTGSVTAEGHVTAKGTDGSTYSGAIQGEKLILREIVEGKDSGLNFTLARGAELPGKPPQAKWAGAYYFGSGDNLLETTLTIAEDGALSGTQARRAADPSPIQITGRVNTVGLVKASSANGSERDGKVTDDAVIFPPTDSKPEIVIPRGARPITRDFHNPAITFPSGETFDCRLSIAENGSVSGVMFNIVGRNETLLKGQQLPDGTLSAEGGEGDKMITLSGRVEGEVLTLVQRTQGEDDKAYTLKAGYQPEASPYLALSGHFRSEGVMVHDDMVTFDASVLEDGSFTCTASISSQQGGVLITGTVDTEGKVAAKDEGGTQYTGTVTVKGVTLNLPDNDGRGAVKVEVNRVRP